jgi:hypothetical protein
VIDPERRLAHVYRQGAQRTATSSHQSSRASLP